MDWTLQSLRITAFVRDRAPVHDLWAILVGKTPEQIVNKPRDGSYTETGLRTDDERLTLSWLPGRAQFEIQPAGLSADLFAALPREPALLPTKGFHDLAASWLATLHEDAVFRLAFGAVLISEQPSRPVTYASLQPLLHNVKLDPESTDLMYRINRPRSSRVLDGLKINRISTWQAISLQQLVAIDDMSTATTATLAVAARLELDVNTDAERDKPVPSEQLPRLLEELVSTAREIALKGDLR